MSSLSAWPAQLGIILENLFGAAALFAGLALLSGTTALCAGAATGRKTAGTSAGAAVGVLAYVFQRRRPPERGRGMAAEP